MVRGFKLRLTKKKINTFNREVKAKYVFFVLMIVGIFMRVFYIGLIPGGLNQDEAFSAYESYSLLHHGIDSSGHAFPVYFVSWGSGMNVLNSYLMMPFIAIFGLHAWTVRLPQVIVACVSLYVLYKMFSRLFNERQALIALFILAICPWHIMMARWGLESNLAPGFLLFGLYAFVLGIERPKFYIVSAVCYGLSLYCYATIWPLVPVLLILQALYLVWVNKFKFSLQMLMALLVLVFLAIPLIFFLLINRGYMDEISTRFFSIPKLLYMRNSEISFTNISGNLNRLWSMLWTQNDGLIWNTTPKFGLYYKGGMIAAIFGFIYCLYRTCRSIIRRKFDGHALLLLQFVTAFGLGCLIAVNVNRINCIHLSIVMFIAVAIFRVLNLLNRKIKFGRIISRAVLTFACIIFISFAGYYFLDYNDEIAPLFDEGLDEAVEYAESVFESGGGQAIYVSPNYSYSKILLFSKYPVRDYIDTVEYTNYPDAFLNVSKFGHYNFDMSQPYDGGIFIIDENDGRILSDYGYKVEFFDETAVAYME